MSVVRSLEVVRISEVENVLVIKSFGDTWFVRCMEAVRISEGPLWEVPLYYKQGGERSEPPCAPD